MNTTQYPYCEPNTGGAHEWNCPDVSRPVYEINTRVQAEVVQGGVNYVNLGQVANTLDRILELLERIVSSSKEKLE